MATTTPTQTAPKRKHRKSETLADPGIWMLPNEDGTGTHIGTQMEVLLHLTMLDCRALGMAWTPQLKARATEMLMERLGGQA